MGDNLKAIVFKLCMKSDTRNKATEKHFHGQREQKVPQQMVL